MKNIAKVHAEVLEDKTVKITGFDNFLNLKGLEEKYGKDVMQEYKSKDPYMGVGTGAENYIIIFFDNRKVQEVFVRDRLSKDEFGRFINLLKECGSNLVRAIRVCNKRRKEAEKQATTVKKIVVEI